MLKCDTKENLRAKDTFFYKKLEKILFANQETSVLYFV